MLTRNIKNMIDADDPRVSRFGHPAPAWLVNYADLMTELVCFFVILYALSAVLSKHIQNAKQVIDEIIEEKNLTAQTKITREGMQFSLQEQGATTYFDVGSADLTPQMISILDELSPVFKQIPNEIVVEGHTDNIPIHTVQFPSNWELSSARATNVVKYFITMNSVPPERISAVGYGEYRPVSSNDTPENRAKNRRVVFFIKNTAPKKQEGEVTVTKE